MPIEVLVPTCRLDQRDFGRITYAVMGCVFRIHNEFGRFFDEKIYKRELSRRYPGTQLEVPIAVSFEGFRKNYFIDALVNGGVVFEFKSCEGLTARHRSQLVHYLMMADLPHGNLVNMRTPKVEHEYINAMLRPYQRRKFDIVDHGWQETGDSLLREWFVALLGEVGTCLGRELYEEALTYRLGGEECVHQQIGVVSRGRVVGTQNFRLVTPGVAFKVTGLTDDLSRFEAHAKRVLEHTCLEAIQWINVGRNMVTFRTIRK